MQDVLLDGASWRTPLNSAFIKSDVSWSCNTEVLCLLFPCKAPFVHTMSVLHCCTLDSVRSASSSQLQPPATSSDRVTWVNSYRRMDGDTDASLNLEKKDRFIQHFTGKTIITFLFHLDEKATCVKLLRPLCLMSCQSTTPPVLMHYWSTLWGPGSRGR